MDAPDQNAIYTAISDANLQIWREAMAHLRHLSDEVNKGVSLFLSLNAFLLGALLLLITHDPLSRRRAILAALLSVMGIFLTIGARFVLKRNRIYYLEMLAKKSLIEQTSGFYAARIADSAMDLAFPWRLKPEVVVEITQDSDAWVQKSIRAKGTIARVYFLIYETLIVIYGVALPVILLRGCC